MNTLKTHCCGEKLTLHADKVVYWHAAKTLLAADVHVGKEHVLGRAGVSIPGGISEATLSHLFRLSDFFSAERLLVLGDFLHGQHTTDEAWHQHLQAQLQTRKELSLHIVAGNHDKHLSQKRINKAINWINTQLFEPPFVFTHEPVTDQRGYVVCGHLHPAYRLQSNGKEKLRAPVFWFQEKMAVLPAFGHFTGSCTVTPDAGDRLFITGPGAVLECTAAIGQ